MPHSLQISIILHAFCRSRLQITAICSISVILIPEDSISVLSDDSEKYNPKECIPAKNAHLICIFSTRTGSFHIVVQKYLFFFFIPPDMSEKLERSTFPFLVFSVIVDSLNVPFQAAFKCLFTSESENVYTKAKDF